MHLVGFIRKKFVTVHGHMKVKKKFVTFGIEPGTIICLHVMLCYYIEFWTTMYKEWIK